MQLKIHSDGGARGNPGPAASAFVVYDESGRKIYEQGDYLGTATNNQAEYQAVLKSLQWVVANHADSPVTLYLDSLLVASQLNGKYKIKNSQLKIIFNEIKKIISDNHIKVDAFNFVYRDKNFFADELVNKTLDQNL